MHEHEARNAIEIGQALRALPLEQPRASAWPALAARLRSGARPRRPWRLWAAAAGLGLLALMVPQLMAPVLTPEAPPQESVQGPADATDALRIDRLAGESAALEAALADADPQAVAAGPTAALRAAVTERMQVVDALLADPYTDPAAQLPLWQERVVLMRQLVGLSRGEELMAAAGDIGEGTLVMTF
ncbi:MAG TPA: hypothetical protein VFG21_04925 [Xanthomonadaceae bacterium]|nr:hypothetical protein [Xanthomonadaceae bacterium]